MKYCFMLVLMVFAVLLTGSDDLKVLRMVTLQYPPYQYIEEDSLQGAAFEVVTEVFKNLGYKIDLEILPWGRALKYVQDGRVDAVFTIYKSDERERFLQYTNEILVMQRVAFFKLKDSNFIYNGDLSSLKDMTISVVQSVNYGKTFQNGIDNNYFNIVHSVDGDRSLQTILHKRADLMVSNVDGANFLIAKHQKQQDIVMVEPLLESIPSYLAFNKVNDYSDLIEQYEKELIRLKNNGTYSQILSKYMLRK